MNLSIAFSSSPFANSWLPTFTARSWVVYGKPRSFPNTIASRPKYKVHYFELSWTFFNLQANNEKDS